MKIMHGYTSNDLRFLSRYRWRWLHMTVQEYYGRDVGVKIMPTGVNCERLLGGLEWEDTKWRRGELQVSMV